MLLTFMPKRRVVDYRNAPETFAGYYDMPEVRPIVYHGPGTVFELESILRHGIASPTYLDEKGLARRKAVHPTLIHTQGFVDYEGKKPKPNRQPFSIIARYEGPETSIVERFEREGISDAVKFDDRIAPHNIFALIHTTDKMYRRQLLREPDEETARLILSGAGFKLNEPIVQQPAALSQPSLMEKILGILRRWKQEPMQEEPQQARTQIDWKSNAISYLERLTKKRFGEITEEDYVQAIARKYKIPLYSKEDQDYPRQWPSTKRNHMKKNLIL